ncbi:MAG: tetratricopeptide repeat protein [Nitrospirales bacterium]|nr:tetratricopeptide repeat protein [Nitrospirales bacterium]
MRNFFAVAILVACVRLWLALNAAPLGLSVSEAHEQDVNRHVKGVEEPWLNAVEGIMNGSPGWPHDPERQFFDRIVAEARRQDYEAAAAGFKLFLELHPTSPLSAQADYWLGECEYQLGHYQDAIHALDRALSRTPFDPQLAAASFLRKGSSYAKLGQVQRSRRLLELLVVQFPTTEEAKEARHALLVP